MPPYPHVRSLQLQNFRGIARLNLRFGDSLTLLAGVNGVGKTAAIEALLGAVDEVWNRLSPDRRETLFRPRGDLLRYGVREGRIAIELALGQNTRTTITMPLQNNGLGRICGSQDEALKGLRGTVSPLPLVANYGQDRNGGAESFRYRMSSDASRDAALNAGSRALSESDEAREAAERRGPDHRDPEVRAVQEVLKSIAGGSILPGSGKPDGSRDRTLFLRRDRGPDTPFESLSGGEQAYFLLAVDLARRLLLEFPGRTLAEAPGIVCIDEIELHLHPAWQRTILTSLVDLFPRCQFIVTTHSPQVIGSVAARHVRLLSCDENGVIDAAEPAASMGRDSNHVLKGIMDTPEQDPEVDGLFAKFDQLVDEGALDEADRVLDTLDELIEGRSSRISLRRAKCRRLRRAPG